MDEKQMTTNPCCLCLSVTGPTYAKLTEQVVQANFLADLIEIRLDLLNFIDFQQLKKIQEDSSIPLIWTLRKRSQGGKFDGTAEEAYSILLTIAKGKPDFMDLEADMPLLFIKNLQQRSPKTKWIISWHDLEKTPDDLNELFERLQKIPADYYKLATFAHSTQDALRILHLSKEVNEKTKKRLCALCMGEKGHCTRILAPLVGHPFTFAALEKGQETAPGQLSAQTLLNVYHFRSLNQQTKLFGLIGDPVDKSLSHLTHNAVFRDLKLNAVYVKFPIQLDELPNFFKEVAFLPIIGLSVTMPFKERVHPWITSMYPSQAAEAYNTLLFKETGIEGYNTDGIGAIKTLGVQNVYRKKVVILGAGGAAQAIAYEAHKLGAQLIILNRTLVRAQALAQKVDAKGGNLSSLAELVQEGYDVLIQATSVGMAPHCEQLPISAEWIYPGARILDVISNPQETQLLKEARLKGCQTFGGIDLFLHQAVQQFVHWFGNAINPQQIEAIMRQHLPSSSSKSKGAVRKSQLAGSLLLPPSKSHSIRAVLLGAMAEGTSRIKQMLLSPDIEQAIQAARQLGAHIEKNDDEWIITGVSGKPQTPDQVIDAGNSGQVLRFVGALTALSEGYTVITGDHSIRSLRPLQPLIDGLSGLGCWAVSTRANGYAPLIVKGPMRPGCITIEGQDSQPVSALLMAAAFMEGKTEIYVKQAGEKPWIALTLSWLDRLGVIYEHHNFEHFMVQGTCLRPPFSLTIPGDLSSVAFPLAAALITGSSLTIHNVDMDDVQGDKELIFLLQKMGALIQIHQQQRCLHIQTGSQLKGQIIDVNDFIDAVPILAVLGCFAQGETHLINGLIARHKECDRLRGITTELKKMGANIEETEEGLKVCFSKLQGTTVKSYEDHRLALALMVAGFGAEGETHVEGIECIQKSYPNFIEEMQRLGANVYKITP